MSLSYMWKSMQTSFSSEYPQKNSLKGNSTKPLNQQENIRKLKVTHEKHFFSGITVHMPSQKKSANTHDTLSDFEVVRNGMNEVSCSTRAKSIIKVSSLVKTNSEGVVSCKKKRSFNYAEYALQTWSLIVGLGHTDVFYVAKYSHRRVTWYLMSKHVGTATKFQTVSKVKWKMPAYVQINVFKHVFIVQIWMPNQTKVTVC